MIDSSRDYIQQAMAATAKHCLRQADKLAHKSITHLQKKNMESATASLAGSIVLLAIAEALDGAVKELQDSFSDGSPVPAEPPMEQPAELVDEYNEADVEDTHRQDGMG